MIGFGNWKAENDVVIVQILENPCTLSGLKDVLSV
jgi:hypothetical protein